MNNMKSEIFSVEKTYNTISLYAIEMINMNKGDIFFRKNKDNSVDFLPRYENDKNYINSIIENFSDGDDYNEKMLHLN